MTEPPTPTEPPTEAPTERRTGVAAVTDPNGSIRVLAIDHRDSLRRFLSPGDPDAVAASDIIALKLDIVRALISHASAVMLEPEFSIPQVLDAGLVPPHVGVIAALEAQGYLDEPASTTTRVLDGWSPLLAREAGASMVKLLLPYRPGSTSAAAQEEVARQVLADSAEADIELALEPLLWGTSDPTEHAALAIETVRRFAPLAPGILKLPFPGGGAYDAASSAIACREITELCLRTETPWALLSGGGSFERFEQQLTIALGEGCAGFMVGRALWGEAANCPLADRPHVLSEVVVPRLIQLNELVAATYS
jgi:tagatose-1,6-bisphosphate aldolase